MLLYVAKTYAELHNATGIPHLKPGVRAPIRRRGRQRILIESDEGEGVGDRS